MSWLVFVASFGSSSYSRLDFGCFGWLVICYPGSLHCSDYQKVYLFSIWLLVLLYNSDSSDLWDGYFYLLWMVYLIWWFYYRLFLFKLLVLLVLISNNLFWSSLVVLGILLLFIRFGIRHLSVHYNYILACSLSLEIGSLVILLVQGLLDL